MKGIYTVLDANLNRAVEGLRVCEDIFRFAVKHKISSDFKALRHRISRTFSDDTRRLLVGSRSTSSDGQKFIDTESEGIRSCVSDIFTANIKRAIESSRVLEETGKALDPSYGAEFQETRFMLYDLEQRGLSVLAKAEYLSRFSNAVYSIIDSKFVSDHNLVAACRDLISSGAGIIQLRMKGAGAGEYLSRCMDISRVCMESNVLFIVNDRPDIAVLSGAAGLHLGQEDVPVDMARDICGDQMVIGVSTHNVSEFDMALGTSADYIALGPVFDTSSKDTDTLSGVGLDFLSHGSAKTDRPLVAIGGINRNNLSSVSGTGIRCVAVISELFSSGSCGESFKKLNDALLNSTSC